MADSTAKTITDSQPRMGRPPIGKFTAVRLPPEMLDRIDAITGPGKRAAFIREAVESELAKREKGKD